MEEIKRSVQGRKFNLLKGVRILSPCNRHFFLLLGADETMSERNVSEIGKKKFVKKLL